MMLFQCGFSVLRHCARRCTRRALQPPLQKNSRVNHRVHSNFTPGNQRAHTTGALRRGCAVRTRCVACEAAVCPRAHGVVAARSIRILHPPRKRRLHGPPQTAHKPRRRQVHAARWQRRASSPQLPSDTHTPTAAHCALQHARAGACMRAQPPSAHACALAGKPPVHQSLWRASW